MIDALKARVTQKEFADLVGISQQKVSELLADGILPREGTADQWLHAYCTRLREQAAGRLGEVEGVDLAYERALLAREQREGQRLKNAIARGEYAPIGLLADVLGAASAGVVDRFDQLEGALRKACPDLPESARMTVMQVIASARNEWIRSTAKLVATRVDELADDQAEDALSEGEEWPAS
ncbi:hypothetical protein [Caldimonas tepidiphila]|uniref:hypothetical protein n=1 Tax=Caldimonas tepidiphila TaxID=2315841 RepID=UPI001F0C3078|nr:hypothetical protein [Caldimonas tepidiphila]